MHDVVALLNPQRIGDVARRGTQHREQFFAGRVAALIEQVLAKTRLRVERVVERAHQDQHADSLAALDPAALHQLVDGATQGVTVHFVAVGELLFRGEVVAATVVRAQFDFELRGDLLPARWVTGRMSG
ncbi:hypothetical protein D3C71_950280 [compost metagenome]